MDPGSMLVIGCAIVVGLAYIYAAAYMTVDTLHHGGPGWLVGILALVALPIGFVLWVTLRREW